MEKYYTPQIEEFHIGFEFQFETGIEGWKKFVLKNDRVDSVLRNVEDFQSQFRVKYLDREDIEILGWKYLSSIEQGTHYFGLCTGNEIKNTIENQWNLKQKTSGKILITQKHSWNRFFGNIKNKSELSKLMKQLNII